MSKNLLGISALGCARPLASKAVFNTPDYELITFLDANTVGTVGAVASIDWGCAVQIMAAASIGSNQNFTATSAQTLYARFTWILRLKTQTSLSLVPYTSPSSAHTSSSAASPPGSWRACKLFM